MLPADKSTVERHVATALQSLLQECRIAFVTPCLTCDKLYSPGGLARDLILQVQGVGSLARIIVPDVKACGSGIVHITDGFMLPFAPSAVWSPQAAAADGPAQPKSFTMNFPRG